MVNTTNHRHNFTDEERIAYNKYMVSRMKLYAQTEKGKEVIRNNNRMCYLRRKAKKLEEQKMISERQEINV